jgi:hypothetical protein
LLSYFTIIDQCLQALLSPAASPGQFVPAGLGPALITFLEQREREPDRLLQLKHADYLRLGGAESVEQIMWRRCAVR